MNERTGDGSTSRTTNRQHGLHDLPGAALPDDGAQAAADVLHVASVADTAMDVADDAAGEREVEEHRPVVGRDGGGQRQVDAEAAGDDRPPPRTADGGDEADGRRRQKSAAVDRARRRRGTGRCRDARRRRRAWPPRPRGAATERRSSRQHQQVGVADGDGEPAGSRLSQTAASIELGVGGQPGLLLARRADPPGEPLDGQAGLCGAEPPRARPDERPRPRACGTPRLRLRRHPGRAGARASVMRRWCASNAAATRESSGSAGASCDAAGDGEREQHRAPGSGARRGSAPPARPPSAGRAAPMR